MLELISPLGRPPLVYADSDKENGWDLLRGSDDPRLPCPRWPHQSKQAGRVQQILYHFHFGFTPNKACRFNWQVMLCCVFNGLK